MPWKVTKGAGKCGGDKPWAVVKESDGSVVACHESEEKAKAQMSALYANEPNAQSSGSANAYAVMAGTSADPPQTSGGGRFVNWEGVLAVEGTPTGERTRRMFTPDALTWAEPPLPLGWEIERSHGGMSTNKVVNVGRIDSIDRRVTDGVTGIYGQGVIDSRDEYGAKLVDRMQNGMASWVSIDADDPAHADVEYVYAAGCDGIDLAVASEADLMQCMEPEQVNYHSGRIRAATLVDIAAFTQARLGFASQRLGRNIPNNAEADIVASSDTDCGCGDQTITVADTVEQLTAAAYTITIDEVPPAYWYDEPESDPEIGAITITPQGRIFGYLAQREVAHRAYPDKRITVPYGNVDYSRWMNRPTPVAYAGGEIEPIAAGPITMDCGHFPVPARGGALAAAEHYDNSCSIVATVRVGENRKGVWVAGALTAGVAPAQVARLLACQLSGDWRAHRDKQGMRELCGILAVPVPGFPVANASRSVRMQAGELVASMTPIVAAAEPVVDTNDSAILTAAGILAGTVNRDVASRAKALAASIGKEGN